MRVARTARSRAVFSRRVGGIVRVVVGLCGLRMLVEPVLIDVGVWNKGCWYSGRSELLRLSRLYGELLLSFLHRPGIGLSDVYGGAR